MIAPIRMLVGIVLCGVSLACSSTGRIVEARSDTLIEELEQSQLLHRLSVSG
jgi:hypothetical protein